MDRLAPERAVEFIDRIVYKFERNPNRGLSLSVWIHAILLRHAAYLMTVPDLVARLRPIYQVRVFSVASSAAAISPRAPLSSCLPVPATRAALFSLILPPAVARTL